MARARRLPGHEVIFLTGTDEHCQNIDRDRARERNRRLRRTATGCGASSRRLWARLDISYDGFIRTTSDAAQARRPEAVGRHQGRRGAGRPSAIYRAKYAGLVCPRCEAFKDESELRQPGNICPDHERPCEWTEEQNYFFRLSASGLAARRIESARMRIRPESGATRCWPGPAGAAGLQRLPRPREVGHPGAGGPEPRRSTSGWTPSPTTSRRSATPTAVDNYREVLGGTATSGCT